MVGNNGKVWLMIGGLMIVIGVAFSIFFSIASEKQINQLVKSCENDGGEAIVKKSGFLVTTSYEFECEK